MMADLKTMLLNCSKLYKSNQPIMENIELLAKELEIIQQEI
jgi:hypothetical protein